MISQDEKVVQYIHSDITIQIVARLLWASSQTAQGKDKELKELIIWHTSPVSGFRDNLQDNDGDRIIVLSLGVLISPTCWS